MADDEAGARRAQESAGLAELRRIADAALQKKTAQEIEEFLIESVATRIPEGLVAKNI